MVFLNIGADSGGDGTQAYLNCHKDTSADGYHNRMTVVPDELFATGQAWGFCREQVDHLLQPDRTRAPY